MNRRAFLQSCAAGTGLAALPAHAVKPVPTCQFPLEPRARLAVASYPFRSELDPKKGTVKLLDFPKLVVDRFNVPGCEPLDEHFASTDAAYLAQFRDALEKARAHVVNIPVGRLHGSFYDSDAAKRKAAVESSHTWVDVAAALGSPSIRVSVLPVRGIAPQVDRAVDSLKEVAQYGGEKNVIINLENDNPQSEDAFYLVEIMESVNSPWLRGLPDFCNSMLSNKGDDYNYRAMTVMFQHACNISHVKEIETDEGKVLKVDVAKTFAIAKQSGYRGYFSIEWDSEGDPYEGTRHLVEAAIKALSAS